MNTFGHILRLTTFGESHGKAVGGIIDGFPSGFKIDFETLAEALEERRPGTSKTVSQRCEEDMPEFLSGISDEGLTLGTPIGFIIRNKDVRSKDYSELEEKYRPNHADYTYDVKYGVRDWRGGGRASARETVNWVVAGALAQQWLKTKDIFISSKLTSAGTVSFTEEIKDNLIRNPFQSSIKISKEEEKRMMEEIDNARLAGDSIGGIVTCLITGLEAGIGSPVFDKLQSRLAGAMLSINAAKGFEYGAGMTAATKRGSEVIDSFLTDSNGKVATTTNNSGGCQGGISNGMPIFFNVAFKPTPTIFKEVPTIDCNHKPVKLQMKGRHDPCVALRAVPVVKAMTALVVADFLL